MDAKLEKLIKKYIKKNDSYIEYLVKDYKDKTKALVYSIKEGAIKEVTKEMSREASDKFCRENSVVISKIIEEEIHKRASKRE